MRRRVEALVPADERARELKLGTGGLRDVEFAVQLLQLVHGRNDESLHVASTVDALAALGRGRLHRPRRRRQPDRVVRVPAAARAPAAAAAAQAHAHAARRRTTTRRCAGWRARRTCGPTVSTTRSGCCARSSSGRACGCRGCTPSCSISRCWSRSGQRWSSAGMTPEAAERQLAALGYESPQSALTHLAALTGHSGRRGRVQQVLLPTLLDWLSDTPDPDARAAGVPPDQRGAGRPALVPVARCATRARWPSG